MPEKLLLAKGHRVGKYVVEEPLGKGGFSKVYLGRSNGSTSYPVAIKHYRFGQDARKTRERRRAYFNSEVRALESIDHPNIIDFYDAITSDEEGFVIMEFLDGQTLREVAHKRTLRQADTVYVGLGVSDALLHLYEKGLIHRDIKPENIMVTKDGRIIVIDFNLCDSAPDGVYVYGSKGYIPPEVVFFQRQDSSSDVYSFGWSMHDAALRKYPKEDDQFREEDKRKLDKSLSGSSPEFVRTISRCVRKQPEKRPSAEELLESFKRMSKTAGRSIFN